LLLGSGKRLAAQATSGSAGAHHPTRGLAATVPSFAPGKAQTAEEAESETTLRGRAGCRCRLGLEHDGGSRVGRGEPLIHGDRPLAKERGRDDPADDHDDEAQSHHAHRDDERLAALAALLVAAIDGLSLQALLASDEIDVDLCFEELSGLRAGRLEALRGPGESRLP
jgi:hypothetical protein